MEIVSNIGASETAPTDQDQEEQELRDAFRVRLPFIFFPLFLGISTPRCFNVIASMENTVQIRFH